MRVKVKLSVGHLCEGDALTGVETVVGLLDPADDSVGAARIQDHAALEAVLRQVSAMDIVGDGEHRQIASIGESTTSHNVPFDLFLWDRGWHYATLAELLSITTIATYYYYYYYYYYITN